jgi:hypothetical protein
MSRIADARRSVHAAKVLVGAASAVALGVFALAVRASHPATHRATASGGTAGAPAPNRQSGDGLDFGGGSIGPSFGTPSTGSGGS